MDDIVHLPCQPGQILYHISGSTYRCIGFRYFFEKDFVKDGWAVEIETDDKLRQSAFSFDDFGIKIFLSQEEAVKGQEVFRARLLNNK